MQKTMMKDASNTLSFLPDVLVTVTGDLYRIATIVSKHFTDEVAINPLDNPKSEKENMKDDLKMGLFVVESKIEFSNSILNQNRKKLKVILFLCKSENQRRNLQKSSIAIVG
jgi:hypothetical protein